MDPSRLPLYPWLGSQTEGGCPKFTHQVKCSFKDWGTLCRGENNIMDVKKDISLPSSDDEKASESQIQDVVPRIHIIWKLALLLGEKSILMKYNLGSVDKYSIKKAPGCFQ